MTYFGGMGGVPGGRPRNPNDLFEAALDRACGDRMRADHARGEVHQLGYFHASTAGAQVWGALANVDWLNDNGDTAGYSFRAAGDMIAAIIGDGDYLDYYCSASYATVPDWIAEAMAKEGWHALPEEMEPLFPDLLDDKPNQEKDDAAQGISKTGPST
jgi:hypothetical protein